ncbi:MAG: hypothetical protein IH989_07025 [Planctomycetes bacterium]|nr:hypothetical protein [Planctomycetota bacterium]
MKRIRPAMLLTCLLALLCAGWGYEGHRIVGAIAWSYLTPEAKAAVAKLLESEGDGSLSAASTWADRIKSDRKWDWAKTLHQTNVQPAILGRWATTNLEAYNEREEANKQCGVFLGALGRSDRRKSFRRGPALQRRLRHAAAQAGPSAGH